MKKFMIMLAALMLCLCACGSEGSYADPSAPTVPRSQTALEAGSGDVQESTASISQAQPWEAPFREEDYVRVETATPEGETITTWHEDTDSGPIVRKVSRLPGGDVTDYYYGPDENLTHLYMHCANGIDVENRFSAETGTLAYVKQVNPDGTEDETWYDENEVPTSSFRKNADGSVSETYYAPDGSLSKDVYRNPATGEYIEQEYSGNGSRKRAVFYDPAKGMRSEAEYYENGNVKCATSEIAETGFFSEQEYYENGSIKRVKNFSSDDTYEAQYNEEGYCTYCHSAYSFADGTPYEIECFADETGTLTKVLQNGEETDAEEVISQCIRDFHFRN